MLQRLLPETICGRDIDEVFAYPSVKMVRIRDARLGIFKLFLMLAICLYVALYELAYQGLYLQSSPVTGAVRFTLQQPTVNNCDPQDSGCRNAFGNVTERAYCAQSSLKYVGNKQRCEYFENIGAQRVESNAILITTRLTTYDQELTCSASDGTNCPYLYNETSQETNYVMDAERFTILVDHSVRAVDVDRRSTSSKLTGRLLVRENSALCKREKGFADVYGKRRVQKAPCYLKPNETSRNLDFFSLGVLLEAADANLDHVNYGGETYRETGASVLLSIEYTTYRPWKGQSELRYTYAPDLVRGSSYKAYDEVYNDCAHSEDDSDDTLAYRQSRTLLNRHGIFIEAAQGGTVRSFLFNNLLVQITTSLTLFAVATVLTDLVALYVMPDRAVYEDYKFDTTPDFGDMRREQSVQQQQQQVAPSLSLEAGASSSRTLLLRSLLNAPSASPGTAVGAPPPSSTNVVTQDAAASGSDLQNPLLGDDPLAVGDDQQQ